MEAFRLSQSLDDNIQMIQDRFQGDEALKTRRIPLPFSTPIAGALFYIEGLTNEDQVNRFIVQPILLGTLKEGAENNGRLTSLIDRLIISGSVERTAEPERIMLALFTGDSLLLAEGEAEVLIIGTAKPETRSVQEPESEKLVRGPREGFTEVLTTNLSMIRKRIKQPELKFQYREMGKRTRTRVCIAYIEDIVSDKILQEVNKRLDDIDIDGILDSGYIQEMIKDYPSSPFETIGYSERPDVIAGKLLEGRIAIFVDGSPAVLSVPFLFVEYFQVSGDYYSNYFTSSFNRLLRFMGALLSISIPAVYVALVTFNQEMIPTQLLLSISSSRSGIPFPTVLEAIMMIVIFEILLEAGTRIPAPIGQAVSIVGALVLGQAAVNARIVSAPMVIVVGLTGITGLLTIRLQGATLILRFLLLGCGSFLGLYGYLMGLIGLLIHLMSIKTFGVNYMYPLSTIQPDMVKDTLLRAPWWDMTVRSKRIAVKNHIRQAVRSGGKPHGRQ
ncbi:spore germination protein [Gorillibacterium timonense]|uniref:spore germination protein n=1 Tax=Gorillibacterium timonense TaxID=1689269 RepID=UPI00071CE1C2|nr:spore germination protein [Gorillibacterium timonense]